MTREECRAAVPVELVEAIKALELPGIFFHPDKNYHCEQLIQIHLCEIFNGCARECVTETLGERFFQLAAPVVQHCLCSNSIPSEAINFMQGIPKQGIVCQTTWPTLICDLHALAETSPEFLSRRLRPQPSRGGCVKINRLQELFGSMYGGYFDALDKSPRFRTLEIVIGKLLPLLDDE